jgi:HEAT repeat protein
LNLYAARFAELKAVDGKKPWEQEGREPSESDEGPGPRGREGAPPEPEVALPTSLDVDYPSWVGLCDLDVLTPEIRMMGRSVVRQLLFRLNNPVAKGPAPASASTPLAASMWQPPPPVWMVSGGSTERGSRPEDQGVLAAFLGPWTTGRVESGEREREREREDELRRSAPLPQPTDRVDVINALGFYLGPSEISVLTPFASAKGGSSESRAAALALGRIGCALAIDDITGWQDWEGGPPRKKKVEKPGPAGEGEGVRPEPPPDEEASKESERLRLPVGVPQVVALAMLDSRFAGAGSTRTVWYRDARSATSAEPGMEYPGRKALERILRDWSAGRLAVTLRAWPDAANLWPRKNFIAALGESGNPHLDEVGLLAECLRFEPGATVEMCQGLMAKSPAFKLGAARVLCRVGDPVAVAQLLAKAKSAGGSEACLAIVALAETRDAAIVDQLKPSIETVLSAGGPMERAWALVVWVELNRRSGGDLTSVVEMAQKYLEADTPEVRMGAVAALARLAGSGDAECLAPALKSKDKQVVIAAIRVLAALGKGQDALAEAMASEDLDILTEVARAAAVLKATSLKPALIAAAEKRLGDRAADPFFVACVDALAKIGGSDVAREFQLPLRTHVSPNVRAAAAIALGEVRATAAVQSLIEALADPDGGVRLAAIDALGRLPAPAAYAQLAQRAFPGQGGYTELSWPALRALVRANEAEGYAALRPCLGPQDVWKLWSLVHAVYSEVPREKRAPCMEFLAALLRSDQKWLRVLAGHALAELELPQVARPALIARDVDKVGLVGPIARVVGEVRNPDDVAALDQLFKTYKPLRGIPPTVEGRPGEREDPERAGPPGPPEVPPEEPIVTMEVDPRVLIIEALGKIGGKDAAAKIAGCMGGAATDDALRTAIRALAQTQVAEAVVPLTTLYPRTRGAVRMELIDALARVGPLKAANAVKTLQEARKDPYPDIAAAAADALEAIERQGASAE